MAHRDRLEVPRLLRRILIVARKDGPLDIDGNPPHNRGAH